MGTVTVENIESIAKSTLNQDEKVNQNAHNETTSKIPIVLPVREIITVKHGGEGIKKSTHKNPK